jgi:molecular chaperone GrpE
MNEVKPTNHPETAQMSDIQSGQEPSDVAQLQEELAQAKEELRREHEMYVRNLADFDNYRRRVERERARAVQAGKREMILALLEVMDDFGRAFEHAERDPKSVTEGLRVIHRRLINLLAAQGVTTYESRGQHFDPMLHEAVGEVSSHEDKPGTVLDEVQPGYRWGQEVLRPARVRIAQRETIT